MAEDARFEDAADERPLRLRAEGSADLAVLSALVQDAVTDCGQASWMPRRRRFTLLLNRFRWEDAERARREGRPFERVRALLDIGSALRVRAQGLDPCDRTALICLLSLSFEEGEDGAGTITIALAGGGTIAIDVECLDVALADVSRPYLARARREPAHPLD
jgi:hypothetical protein